MKEYNLLKNLTQKFYIKTKSNIIPQILGMFNYTTTFMKWKGLMPRSPSPLPPISFSYFSLSTIVLLTSIQ